MSTIAEIVHRGGLTLTPDTPIRRAAALMVEGPVDAAPVVDDSGRLVGVLTQKDCFRPALQASYYREWKGTVADFMSRTVVSLPVSTDLVTAAEAFMTHPHRTFPVMDGENLVGTLRRSDLLGRLLSLG